MGEAPVTELTPDQQQRLDALAPPQPSERKETK